MQSNGRAKLTFGMNDNGGIVHVSEVSSGLRCNCKCPDLNCKAQLIAKKGKKRIDHFAHWDAPECSASIESALHFAAKQLFEQESMITLPEVSVLDPVTTKLSKVPIDELVA
jgi:competence CoiA-like predicted nuclease